MRYEPFYNPEKTYYDNYKDGPFGVFAGNERVEAADEPAYSFLGVRVHAPFGIPSGPLINSRFVMAALDKGFSIPVYKTVRSRAYPCHAWPNVLGIRLEGDLTLSRAQDTLTADHEFHDPISITNSFGVPSFDPDEWQRDMARAAAYARDGQAVVGSFQGTKSADGSARAYIDDFVRCARLVKETGVKILEVNLSCPNEGTAHLLCFDAERTRLIAEAVKNEIGNTPLILKIAYFENDDALASWVEAAGPIADAISAINTISAPIVDARGAQALPGEGRVRSGVCGHAIKWAGLDMARRLHALRDRFHMRYAIAGVGGVVDPADFQEYMSAGADAVMSATGAIWNPYLARDVQQAIASKV